MASGRFALFLVTVAGDASSVEIKAFFQAAMKIVLTNLFP